jgi:hypothetical protein
MFIVAGAQKKCRTASHPYMINFVQCTMIQEVTPQPENFPLYPYFKVSFILHYICHWVFYVSIITRTCNKIHLYSRPLLPQNVVVMVNYSNCDLSIIIFTME